MLLLAYIYDDPGMFFTASSKVLLEFSRSPNALDNEILPEGLSGESFTAIDQSQTLI